jgi:hypothetical protein
LPGTVRTLSRRVTPYLFESVQLAVVVLDRVDVVVGASKHQSGRDDSQHHHDTDKPTDQHRLYSTGWRGCSTPQARCG